MKMTFRWYGKNSDPVTLKQIRQIPGMTGVMGFLDYKPAGEVWTKEEIAAYIKDIKEAGLECEVIESVNVHEDIKMGLPTRDKYIDAYIETIRNLAEAGVKVIIYNFMPVLDWLRTDLAREIPEDGSNSLYYDDAELQGLTAVQLVENTLKDSKGFSMPGWEPERLAELKITMKRYEEIDEDKLAENYKYFLDAVIPVCEEVGVKMACHPDDPAWPIFGLPRLAHDQAGFDRIVKLHDSPANTICLCTGSLGSNPENEPHRRPAHPQREVPGLPEVPRSEPPELRRKPRHVRHHEGSLRDLPEGHLRPSGPRPHDLGRGRKTGLRPLRPRAGRDLSERSLGSHRQERKG